MYPHFDLASFLEPDYAEKLPAVLLVPHYLVHCHLYYDRNTSIVPDHQFDRLARRLEEEWGAVDHPHKHVINPDALRSGGRYLSGHYPAMVAYSAQACVDGLRRITLPSG